MKLCQAGLLERLAEGSPCPRDSRRMRSAATRIRERRRTGASPAGGVTLPAAVWDEISGAGIAVLLHVAAVSPEKSGVAPSNLLPDAAESFRFAARGAWSAVGKRWGTSGGGFPCLFRVSFQDLGGRPLREPVHGRSASAAAAVGVLAAVTGLECPPGLCVLGEVGSDGRLYPVDRCSEKLEALAREAVAVRDAWVVGEAPGDAGFPFPVRTLPPGSTLEQLFDRVFGDASALAPPRLRLLTDAHLEQAVGRLEREGGLPQLERLRDLLSGREGSPRLHFLLHRALGGLYSHLGRLKESGDHLGTAAESIDAGLADERLDPEEASELCTRLGVHHTDLHRWAEARAWFERGRRLLQGRSGLSARVARARLDASEGQMWLWSGDPGRAEPLLRAALSELGEARHLNYLAGALIRRARSARLAGETPPAGGLREARECLDESSARGDLSGESACLANRAFVLYWRARLAVESLEPDPRLLPELERLERASAPAYPLTLARVWLDLGPAGDADPAATAAALQRLRTDGPGPLLPLLAMGATLRLWASPSRRPALLDAWGATGAAHPADGAPGRKETADGTVPAAAILPALVILLDALAPLTPAFEPERARVRSWLPPAAAPPDAHLLPALAALAERIGY